MGFRELGVLTLDPVFIQDLTILYTAAAVRQTSTVCFWLMVLCKTVFGIGV